MGNYLEEYEIKTSKGTEFYDITEKIKKSVLESKIFEGHVLIQPLHTTVGIYLNEFEKRLVNYDLKNELSKEYPIVRGKYKHDDIRQREGCPEDEPMNANSHLKAMFCSNPSLSLILHEGELLIGKYQRIIFAEFDGPCPRKHKSSRKYLVSIIGE
jgi:secondary thiamine-phosphate synthase enzyme